jgi:hypothetical protein
LLRLLHKQLLCEFCLFPILIRYFNFVPSFFSSRNSSLICLQVLLGTPLYAAIKQGKYEDDNNENYHLHSRNITYS